MLSPNVMLGIVSSIIIFGAVFLFLRSVGGVWDGIAKQYVTDLMPDIRALRLNEDGIPIFLRWWGVSMVGTAFVFIFLLRMVPLAVPALFLVYVTPRLYLKWRISRRQQLLRDQLVGATRALANTLRAGLALANGLETVAHKIEDPLAIELKSIHRDFAMGLPLAASINRAKDRLQLDGFTLFAATLLTSLERGGKITVALDKIAYSLQENQRLERKLEAETASGKKVVMILAAFPLFFLALFAVVYPEGTFQVFNTIVGQIALAVVVLLVYLSVRWSQKILTIEV